MAHVEILPVLGNTVESCLIVGWAINEGEAVTEGAVLCEVETDKATMDVVATASGTLLKQLVEIDDDVPVKDPLAVIGQPGEDWAKALEEAGFAAAEATEPEAQAPAAQSPAEQSPAPAAPPAAPAADNATPASGISPRARNLAQASGLPPQAVETGSGPHGRVIERDVAAELAKNPGLTQAARAAGAAGVAGTGTALGGRLGTADLAAPAQETPAATAPATSVEFPGNFTDTPIKGIRKLIAERMMNSLATTAQLTITASAPAAGLLALRSRVKNAPESTGLNGVTIGDLVAWAAARVARDYPMMNAHVENGVLRTFEQVHLGLAVDTPRGLMVPTIRGASVIGLREFSASTKALAAACIEGSISPELLSGGTFTITNLGSFGVESFTPVLNAPQTAILGVNTITTRPTMDGGVEQRIGLSLTIDHQVVDGADAARYLRDLTAAIANIDLTVIG